MVNVRIDLQQTERNFNSNRRLFSELPIAYQRRVVGPAVLAWGRVIARLAKKTTIFADVSGRLRKSIFAKRWRSRKGLPEGVYIHAGGRGARQAHLVEFGHGGPHPAPPHPFMETATEQSISRGQAEMARVFNTRTVRLAHQLVLKYNTLRNPIRN